MFDHEPLSIWWVKSAIMVAFASVAGFLGYVMRAFDNRARVLWTRAIIESMAAGFVGALTLLMCGAMGLSDQWTGVTVGVAGWLGANASMGVLSRVVFKRLGIEQDKEDNDYVRRDTKSAFEETATSGIHANCGPRDAGRNDGRYVGDETGAVDQIRCD